VTGKKLIESIAAHKHYLREENKLQLEHLGIPFVKRAVLTDQTRLLIRLQATILEVLLL
jgi:hypothetical protein